MKLAVDVDYRGNKGCIAGISFADWPDPEPTAVYTSVLSGVAEYVSGAFFKRELPCILHLLEAHDLAPDCLVIDGLVHLDGQAEPGLGRYLYDSLAGNSQIIGVAKRPFRTVSTDCAIYRGQSTRPLYVTAAGISLGAAKECISSMYGQYRIPELLRQADRACRALAC